MGTEINTNECMAQAAYPCLISDHVLVGFPMSEYVRVMSPVSSGLCGQNFTVQD